MAAASTEILLMVALVTSACHETAAINKDYCKFTNLKKKIDLKIVYQLFIKFMNFYDKVCIKINFCYEE